MKCSETNYSHKLKQRLIDSRKSIFYRKDGVDKRIKKYN